MPFANFAGHSLSAVSVTKNAPSCPGVYGLCNSGGFLLISASQNIRADLLRHVDLFERQATGFTYEVCSPGTELSRQDRLIRELKPLRRM